MQSLELDEQRQKLPRIAARMTVPFELGNDFPLAGNMSLALGDMPFRLCQVRLYDGLVHRLNIHPIRQSFT